ncbi:hypothetical protein H920_13817 [Fukomys damarensis]|uniref:Uncharacterized protein n=1 Tax=Fukomys damarensis TaxID=885580 RepID=A0A091DPT4_FUKDA|nr:hypothetical protein H920_13817 [Fukomys damarensis]
MQGEVSQRAESQNIGLCDAGAHSESMHSPAKRKAQETQSGAGPEKAPDVQSVMLVEETEIIIPAPRKGMNEQAGQCTKRKPYQWLCDEYEKNVTRKTAPC